MALDLHVLEGGRPGKLLYKIEEEQYHQLGPALELFRERTGIVVDQHSDTKFSSGMGPLIKALQDSISSARNLTVRQSITSLLAVLMETEQKKLAVIFVGD
jgi:hypothetical protein